MESKVKKTCADYDLAILRSYRYIPVYTKYNLVYTMWVQTQWQLSYFLFQGSVLLLDPASIHPPCTVQHSLQPKVKKKTCDGNQVCRLSVLGAVHKCIYRYILRTAWPSGTYGDMDRPPRRGLQGGACRAQTTTATRWLHRHCCPVVRPKQQRRHSQMGSLLGVLAAQSRSPRSQWTIAGPGPLAALPANRTIPSLIGHSARTSERENWAASAKIQENWASSIRNRFHSRGLPK